MPVGICMNIRQHNLYSKLLERKISLVSENLCFQETIQWTVQVTVSRRGLRNQLKTFLFRSKSNAASETPRAGAAAAGGPSQYGAATTEGQMRQLADLAFVMQDYETAQSTLKLLASDYKTDKAWKHLAGVQVGLCFGKYSSQTNSKPRLKHRVMYEFLLVPETADAGLSQLIGLLSAT